MRVLGWMVLGWFVGGVVIGFSGFELRWWPWWTPTLLSLAGELTALVIVAVREARRG